MARMNIHLIDQELMDSIERKAAKEGVYAVSLALFALADANESIATQLKYLGNGDAATTHGAIEGHAMQIRDTLSSFADTIAEALREGFGDLTRAIKPEEED